MRKVITILLLSFLLNACKKAAYPEIPQVDKGVLLVNEGNFNWGNAGLSLYDPAHGSVTKDVFKDVNGFTLGDVAQSAIVVDSLVYVVTNNSAKIVVLSAKTFKQKSIIAIAGSSPRYLMPINDTIAYVTELYANKIWIVNIRSGVSTGSIAVAGETNQMVKVADKVFVAERTKFNGPTVAQIRVLNTVTHQTEKVIPLPAPPNSICKDVAGNIWVLTDTAGGKPASLVSVNQGALSTSKQLDFAVGKTPHHLRYNIATHELCYLVGNDVYATSTTVSTLPSIPLLTLPASVLYAFDVDANGKYYLADAIDYTQSAKCFIYNADGTQHSSFTAGINTNQFVFLP